MVGKIPPAWVRESVTAGVGTGVACIFVYQTFHPPVWVLAIPALVGLAAYAAIWTIRGRRRPPARTMEPGEFMRLYRARKIGWDLLDEYVERWHRATPHTPTGDMALHQYLGMTWQQWREWTGPKRRRPTGGNDGFVRLDDV